MAAGGVATLVAIVVVAACAATVASYGEGVDYTHEKDPAYWLRVAQTEMEAALKERQRGVAKNVILFLGDGMGPTTVTAARILSGQMKGRTGEDVMLSFDMFPYTGLSKTYNTNRQVTDSAASGTAYLTGVKTNQGMLGLDARASRANCSSVKGAEVDSILRWSRQAGKSVGVVTTTRITHATPAASYSHSPERNWESDALIPDTEKACEDIALQLITRNKDINVILGGGRAAFYPTNYFDEHADADDDTKFLRRTDGKNLIQEWEVDKITNKKKFKYVYDRDGLDAIDAANTDYVLGLFNQDHLQYEKQRDKTKEPSIAEMTAKAIQILKKNEKGFFLLVEGGRIDHGHHSSQPSLALHDTVAFADAVDRATKLTDASDTLKVVTADHSHTMAISGYPSRGNPILGISAVDNVMLLNTNDTMPYTTLLYANGPGHTSPRQNITEVNTEEATYTSQSAVPLSYETHGGEDVAIYAHGPQSFLYSGVHEQNYIPMVMAYASCVGPYAEGSGRKCAKHEENPATPKVRGSATSAALSVTLISVCLVLQKIIFMR